MMPCGLEKAGVKCKHLPSQKKGTNVVTLSVCNTCLSSGRHYQHCPYIEYYFVVSHSTGWCIHMFFCAVFLSLLNSIVTFLNKFDYPCQLRAIKSIKPSFLEVPYASYYSSRYFPHQHYDTVLFDHKSLLAHQLKFKTFLNIATRDHVQLQ